MYEAEEMGVELPRENTVQREEIIQQNDYTDVEATPIDDVVTMDEI